jgi:ribonuclease P protein component
MGVVFLRAVVKRVASVLRLVLSKVLSKRFHLPIQSATSRASRNVRLGGLTLKVFTTDLPYGRFGVIIPKAVARTAVLRNKLKRALFEAFKGHMARFIGRDILCIVSKGAPLEKDAIMKELGSLLAKL